MSFYLNNSIPTTALVCAFIVFSCFTVLIYRKHKLSRPWHFWLPALRIAGIGLLILALFQPVFVRTEEIRERGRIAVLVDDSGSMSIGDDYSLPRQVEVSSRLQLFPEKLRSNVFDQESINVAQLAADLHTVEGRLTSLIESIRRKNEQEEARRTAQIKPVLEQIPERLTKLHHRMKSSVKSHDYLQAELRRDEKPRSSAVRGLFYKRWEGIGGWEVNDLLSSPKFKREPDHASLIPSFDAPRGAGQLYGAVIQGYIQAPETGEYEFMFCSDDQGILYLSKDHRPENKRLICQAKAWSTPKKFDMYPEQKSKPIRLLAGESYYVEAVFKENQGDDHLTVAWKRPGGKVEAPIPGEHLTPYGVLAKGYGDRSFPELYPETDVELRGLRARLAKLGQLFAEGLAETDVKARISTLVAVQKLSDSLANDLDEAYFSVVRLQRAADVQLAQSNIPQVNLALERFSQMKRIDIVKWLLTRKPYDLLNRLEERGIPQVFVMDEGLRELSRDELASLKAARPRTDLGAGLRALLKYYENRLLAGVVVFSDGNNNAGEGDLREIREIAREREIPICALGIGSERLPKDVAVDTVVAPSTSFRNNSTRISIVLKRDGFTNQPIVLKLTSDDRILHQEILPPGTESRVSLDMTFVETRSGVLEYTVEAQAFDDEEVKHNNRKSFTINILKDAIRTLLIDEFPRWESRFCGIMLKSDHRFDLDTVYLNSQSDTMEERLWAGGSGSLSAYQILILGDVNPRHFSMQQLEDIRKFVVDRGGTIIFLSGRHHMPKAFLSTPISDLIPVQNTKTRVRKASWFVTETLTPSEDSQYDPLIQISETPAVSTHLWQRLPRIPWVRSGVMSTRTADTLVETRRQTPVLLKSNVGLGKVLYVGTDEFWRWRYKAGGTYHHRLWGQILLWATLGRTTGSDRYVKFMTSRPDYTPGETVELTARILNDSGLPFKNARASAKVFDLTTGRIVRIAELKYIPNSGGKYLASLPDLPRGKYRVVPVVQGLGRTLKAATVFEIRDLPTSEYVDLALKVSELKAFSTEYRPYEDALAIIDRIDMIEVPRQTRSEWEIWDTQYLIAALALLLGLEWLLRKRQQLV